MSPFAWIDLTPTSFEGGELAIITDDTGIRMVTGDTLQVSLWEDDRSVRGEIEILIRDQFDMTILSKGFLSPFEFATTARVNTHVAIVSWCAGIDAAFTYVDSFRWRVPLILVQDNLDAKGLLRLIRLNIGGIVCRSSLKSDVVRAVRAVAGGVRFISPEFSELIAEAIASPGNAAFSEAASVVPGETTLTSRERQVLGLVCQGLTNRQIAKVLHVTEKTAKYHVSNILSKTGFQTRAQVIASATPRAAA